MSGFGNAVEKRRERRFPEENHVTLEMVTEGNSDPGKKICFAVTRDLSMGGMRLSCNTFYPVKTPLKVNLRLKRTRRLIRTRGTIRWVRSLYENELFDCGLQFDDVTPELSMILLEHLYGRSSH